MRTEMGMAVETLRAWARDIVGDATGEEANRRINAALASVLPVPVRVDITRRSELGEALLGVMVSTDDLDEQLRRTHAWHEKHEGEVFDGRRVTRIVRDGKTLWTYVPV